jgi:hypothetical protein
MYRNTTCVRAYNDYKTLKMKQIEGTKNELIQTMSDYFTKKTTREETIQSIDIQSKRVSLNIVGGKSVCCG